MRLKTILLPCLLALALPAMAQEGGTQGIPNEVFYLMPSFGDGVVFFSGMAPARGELNICAVDNTLRFKDKDGRELEASNPESIIKVRIDTVSFLRHGGIFYRMYPLTVDIGIALRREVIILRDVKQGAFGTTSQTSAIREYNTFYADGVAYNLNPDKEYPYRVTETLFLYRGNSVLPLKKKSLQKAFPAHKADIDAFFKAGGKIPGKIPEALELLSQWIPSTKEL